jgi:hypothetical protein
MWATADDVWTPDYVRAGVALLDAHPDVVLAYGRTRFIDGTGRSLDLTDPGWHLPQASALERFRYVMASGHWVNSLVGVLRRDALARTRLLPDYPGGDYALLGELALLGKLIELPDSVFLRRLHEGSISQHAGDPEWRARYFSRSFAGALPSLARLRDHLHTILRADVPVRDKLTLTRDLLRHARWQRRGLWQELRRVLNGREEPR